MEKIDIRHFIASGISLFTFIIITFIIKIIMTGITKKCYENQKNSRKQTITLPYINKKKWLGQLLSILTAMMLLNAGLGYWIYIYAKALKTISISNILIIFLLSAVIVFLFFNGFKIIFNIQKKITVAGNELIINKIFKTEKYSFNPGENIRFIKKSDCFIIHFRIKNKNIELRSTLKNLYEFEMLFNHLTAVRMQHESVKPTLTTVF